MVFAFYLVFWNNQKLMKKILLAFCEGNQSDTNFRLVYKR